MVDRGRLACVGVGMMLGAHLTPRARSEIAHAEVVFAAVSDPLVEIWVQRMHPDVRSLQHCYADGRSRHDTYRRMVSLMLDEVRAGRRVCGVFYGHPGVFATVPHKAIAQAREEGHGAHMEAAVSAEDCLYADLGIDPGRNGCQHFETSQYMLYERTIDPSSYLILWQIGVAGDVSVTRTRTGPAHRGLLVEKLSAIYPSSHVVTLYEAATLPIRAARIEHFALSKLRDATPTMHSTLVLPPAAPMKRDEAMRARIAELESSLGEVPA